MELLEAKEQLVFAQEHLDMIAKAKSHKEFRKWWQAFRTCLVSSIYSVENKLKKEGVDKGNAVFKPVFRVKKQSETEFIIQSRHVSTHKVDPISELEPGFIQLSPGESQEGEAQPDGSVIYPDRELVRVKIKPTVIKLLPVENRKAVYSVPEYETQEGFHKPYDPVSLGKVSLMQVADVISEIENLFSNHYTGRASKRAN